MSKLEALSKIASVHSPFVILSKAVTIAILSEGLASGQLLSFRIEDFNVEGF